MGNFKFTGNQTPPLRKQIKNLPSERLWSGSEVFVVRVHGDPREDLGSWRWRVFPERNESATAKKDEQINARSSRINSRMLGI